MPTSSDSPGSATGVTPVKKSSGPPLNPKSRFKKFVNRYTAIDHHDANSHEVGLIYVLSPAKNPADLAALYTIAENSEPEMAGEIREYIAYIEAHPDRKLGSYGQQNLGYITHPAVKPFADARTRKQ